MSTIELGCRLEYQVESRTSFLFQVSVLESPRQQITFESLLVNPETEFQTCRLGLTGNRVHRLVAQPGVFNVNYVATVSNDPRLVPSSTLLACEHTQLPGDVLVYLNPSRYCESDRLERFAWNTFGHRRAGHDQVQAVADWVFEHLRYSSGSTGPSTTACDVLVQREGVCRDFAHLMIAVCRSLGIPARYVAGYAVNLSPPDFHGFVEAYLDGAWFLFDATRLAPVNGFVRIGAGRDAADLSFATFIGNCSMSRLEVWASETNGASVQHVNAAEFGVSLS